MGASLFDFHDRDLMHRLAAEGSMTSGELAEALGLKGHTAAQAVGIRGSWMREYGWWAFDREARQWSLTEVGERIVESHVRARLLREISELPPEQIIDLMAQLNAIYQTAEPAIAIAYEREFAHNRYLRHHRNGGGR